MRQSTQHKILSIFQCSIQPENIPYLLLSSCENMISSFFFVETES